MTTQSRSMAEQKFMDTFQARKKSVMAERDVELDSLRARTERLKALRLDKERNAALERAGKPARVGRRKKIAASPKSDESKKSDMDRLG